MGKRPRMDLLASSTASQVASGGTASGRQRDGIRGCRGGGDGRSAKSHQETARTDSIGSFESWLDDVGHGGSRCFTDDALLLLHLRLFHSEGKNRYP